MQQQTLAVVRLNLERLSLDTYQFVTLTSPNNQRSPICSLLIKKIQTKTVLSYSKSPPSSGEKPTNDSTISGASTSIPAFHIHSSSSQNSKNLKKISDHEISITSQKQSDEAEQNRLRKVQQIESSQLQQHTIQDLQCEQTLQTYFSSPGYNNFNGVHNTCCNMLKKNSDQMKKDILSIQIGQINKKTQIYDDKNRGKQEEIILAASDVSSSCNQASDISQGELGQNKQNLPLNSIKFARNMGGIQKLLGMKGKINSNYLYASPIAKTKSLKNVFIGQTLNNLKKKQMNGYKSPLTARDKMYICNTQGVKQTTRKQQVKRASVQQIKKQKKGQAPVYVVERGNIMFAESYHQKPRLKSHGVLDSVHSPIKFPNTQGSFYASKKNLNSNRLKGSQVEKPNAYRKLFDKGCSSNKGQKNVVNHPTKKVIDSKKFEENRQLKSQRFLMQFQSNPTANFQSAQFKEPNIFMRAIKYFDQEKKKNLETDTTSNLSTNNSVSSRASNINRPTAQFGQKRFVKDYSQESTGPFKQVEDPETFANSQRERIKTMRVAICENRQKLKLKDEQSCIKQQQQQKQKKSAAPFDTEKKNKKKNIIQTQFEVLMNNGYRYSFSFEKLKRKMKPFSMR